MGKRDVNEELSRDFTWIRQPDFFDHKDEEVKNEMRFNIKNARLEYERRKHAESVIDEIAEFLGLSDKGLFLYGLIGGTTPIIEHIRDFFVKGGDKVKLKKRIDELETENSVLRSLIGK